MKQKKIFKVLCLILVFFAFGGGIFLLSYDFSQNVPNENTTEASTASAKVIVYTMTTSGNTQTESETGLSSVTIQFKGENGTSVGTRTVYGPGTVTSDDKLWWNKFIISVDSVHVKIGYSLNSVVIGNYTFLSKDVPTTGVTVDKGTTTEIKIYIDRLYYYYSFNQNGGSGGQSGFRLRYQENFPSSVSVPTRTGYNFEGYYLGMNAGSDAEDDDPFGYRIYNSSGTRISSSETAGGYHLLEFTAMWAAKPYTLTFNKQNGSGGTSSSTVYYNDYYPSSISVPSRTGYAFQGYYTGTNGSGTQRYNSSGSRVNLTNMTGNTTLYAYWTANPYTLTLDRQSGSGGTSSATIYYNSYYPYSISVPNRTGYTFQGYYTSANGGGTQRYNSSGSRVNSVATTGNVTLYAYWTINSYSLTFDRQSGSGGTASTLVNYGSYYPTSISVPSRTGYTFQGYYTSANGGGTQRYNSSGNRVNAVTMGTSRVTLYAYWTINSHTISLSRGAGISSVSGAGTYNYNTSRTVSCVVSVGYSFSSWSGTYSSTSSSYSFTMPDNNVSMTANATPTTYSITFIPSGGTANGSSSNTTRYYNITASSTISGYSNVITSLPSASRTGYTFAGWKPSSTVGSWSSSSTYTGSVSGKYGNITLVAQWTINSYTVSLTRGTGISSVSGAGTYNYGTTRTVSCVASTGYHFNNWTGSYSSTSSSYTFTMPASNVSLTANGVANTYTVVFHGNGNTGGSTANQSYTYDQSQALRANGFTKTGYHFNGWQIDYASICNFIDNYGVNVTSGQLEEWTNGYTHSELMPFINTSGRNVELTSNYIVCGIYAYDVNGNFIKRCSNYATSHSIPSGTHYIRVEVNRSNLAYGDRTKLRIFGTEVLSDKQNVKNLSSTHGGTVNLYAKWEKNTYTIAFNANGGTGSMTSIPATYDENTTLPQREYAKAGYNFLGWSTSNTATSETYLDKHVVRNLTSTNNGTVTLYAVWGETWAQSGTQPTGLGTSASPYKISSAENLAWLAGYIASAPVQDRSVYAEQTNQISLVGKTWYPIGTSSNPFLGSYNGNGYAIIGLTTSQVKDHDGNYVESFAGIFGEIASSAKIESVNIYSAEVYGHDATGILVGNAKDNSKIINSYATGMVTSSLTGGGVVGCSNGLTITNSGFKGTVNSKVQTGMLVAWASSSMTTVIKDCFGVSENAIRFCYPSNETSGKETISNCVYISNGTKGYYEGDFANWVISTTETPLPSGLTWLGTAVQNANLDKIKEWANS